MIKFLAFLLFPTVILAYSPVIPSHGLTHYSSREPNDSIIVLLTKKYDELGYKMPSEGQEYYTDDYFAAVPDNKPLKDDLCIFTSPNKEEMEGIVLDFTNDLTVVYVPLEGGVSLYLPVKNENIEGFLRPKFRKDDKSI